MKPLFAFAAALLLCLNLSAEPSTDCSEPEWSPDGGKILHVEGHFPEGREVMIMNADGSGVTQVTNIPGRKWYLSVSTTGRMTYTCIEDRLDRIYVLESDGTGLKRVSK